MPVILATSETEIRRIMVPGKPRQKNWQDPISTEKAGRGGCTPVILAIAGSIRQED
jgi:hypothetical protein